MSRIDRFISASSSSKFRSFAFRWFRWFPNVPLPIRLPFAARWLLRNDQLGGVLLYGVYESDGVEFLQRFLRPGMTVVDAGANQGYFTLLSSIAVGKQGRVIAIEPSEREMRHLKHNLALNFCKNVTTEFYALGEFEESGTIHVVLGSETGCNSLHPPDVSQPTKLVSVSIRRLDDLLRARGIPRVDLIKLDVEGAELSVLKGAEGILHCRPVILVEVQDQRTLPWGYPANKIIQFLCSKGYVWFEPGQAGRLTSISPDLEKYDGNFVAVPAERVLEFAPFINPNSDA